MGFGIFFHDFHMSGSGIRSHTFATMKTKQIQTSNFGGSHLYGCHRHVANKTNSCSQVCAVFVLTKCTPNKKSQYFEYWKNIISIKFFGFCGFLHIFIFIDILTHAPYSNHTQNTPYVVVSFCSCRCCLPCFLFQCRIFFRCRWRSWIWRESCQTKATPLRSPGHWLWFRLRFRITGNHIHQWFCLHTPGGTPDFSQNLHKAKTSFRKCWWRGPGYFSAICGWDFETQILPWFATPLH